MDNVRIQKKNSIGQKFLAVIVLFFVSGLMLGIFLIVMVNLGFVPEAIEKPIMKKQDIFLFWCKITFDGDFREEVKYIYENYEVVEVEALK